MTPKSVLTLFLILIALMAFNAQAQHEPATPAALVAKVSLNGDARGIRITDMRASRQGELLKAQSALLNVGTANRYVFYRYQWLDHTGQQVGDGDAWKQLMVLGMTQQTAKSVAPSPLATDFRLEMNVE